MPFGPWSAKLQQLLGDSLPRLSEWTVGRLALVPTTGHKNRGGTTERIRWTSVVDRKDVHSGTLLFDLKIGIQNVE